MYTNFHHQNWTNRMTNWFRTFQQLREEAQRLDGIWTNEAVDTGNPYFNDTAYNTVQELVDGVTFMRAIETAVTGGAVPEINRVSNITPFLAGN